MNPNVRKQAEVLKHRLRQERFIAAASTRLANLAAPAADQSVREILAGIGQLTQTSRCFLFSVSKDLAIVDNTHEWCAPGVKSLIDRLRNVPTSAFPWLLAQLQNGEPFLLASSAELPAEAEAERRLLQEGSVRSAILTPIRHAGIPSGFIGCDDVRNDRCWSEEDVRLLRIVGEQLFDALARLQMSERLRASEELNRQTLQALPTHIAVIDRDGRIVTVNEAWTDFARGNTASGSSAVQVGANYLEACRRAAAADSADAVQALCGIKAVLAGTTRQFTLEYACHSPEEQRWYLMTVTPLGGRDATGAVIAHFDITERKLAEKAMWESEQRIQLALHVSHSFTFDWHPSTDTVLRSDSCATILGLAGAAVCHDTGQRYFQRVHPDDRTRFVQMLHALSPDADRYTTEYRLSRDDNTVVMLEETGKAIFDDAGKLQRLVGVCADITERKRTEAVLRFLGQCGTATSGEGFFQELARFLGRTLEMDFVCIDRLEDEHLSAQTLAVYHDGRFDDAVSYTLKDTPCGSVVGQNVCCFPRNVQSLFPKDAMLQSLQAESYLGTTLWNAQGQPIGLIAVIGRKPLADTRMEAEILQLVSVRAAGELERLRAEEALARLNAELEQRVALRTAELAATNRELESFCYSVSHDLRAPLRSMDGFSLALLEDYGTRLDAEGQDYLNRIRSNCQRMARLIDDLLHLSRLAWAQMRHQTVNLTALAHAIIGELRQAEPERAVAVRIAPGLSATGDPVLLQAALTNLLQNAWKFTSKRTDAVIEVGTAVGNQPDGVEQDTHAESCVPRPASSPVFFVRDNGVGFDMRYADKLFTPFQRLHALTDFTGSGIGLATVQRIIHRHGGRVWFESAPGAGATFFFMIGNYACG